MLTTCWLLCIRFVVSSTGFRSCRFWIVWHVCVLCDPKQKKYCNRLIMKVNNIYNTVMKLALECWRTVDHESSSSTRRECCGTSRTGLRVRRDSTWNLVPLPISFCVYPVSGKRNALLHGGRNICLGAAEELSTSAEVYKRHRDTTEFDKQRNHRFASVDAFEVKKCCLHANTHTHTDI